MKEVIRENKIGYSRLQQNNLGISFRAIYGTDKMSISNILSLDATNRPRLNSNGTVTFTPKIYQTSDYISTSSSNVIYPTWTGNFYFDLGRNFQLNTVTKLQYQKTKAKVFIKVRAKRQLIPMPVMRLQWGKSCCRSTRR